MYDTHKRSKIAQERTRDSEGHFIKDENLDDALVSVRINNPFKKILFWLNDIRKKQTTTFSIQLKIPLIALPIFLIILGGAFSVFFNLGKTIEKQAAASLPIPTPIVIIQPTRPPEPVLVSRLGVIKATYQVTALLLPTATPFTTSEPDVTEGIAPSPTSSPIPSRYVLVGKLDQITFLIVPPAINLNNYLNQRALITGLYDKTNNTLKISKSQDIEILP